MMPDAAAATEFEFWVSVPFDAGRGLMRYTAENSAKNPAAFQYPSMRVVD